MNDTNHESLILKNIEDGILTLTINRPKQLNALNSRVISELSREIDSAEKNFNIKLADSEEILMEARLRIGSRDRLPMAGCIDKNVYVLGALGTRGFSLAPILGDYIASLINHSPNPISSGIALAIDPLRFKD